MMPGEMLLTRILCPTHLQVLESALLFSIKGRFFSGANEHKDCLGVVLLPNNNDQDQKTRVGRLSGSSIRAQDMSWKGRKGELEDSSPGK